MPGNESLDNIVLHVESRRNENGKDEYRLVCKFERPRLNHDQAPYPYERSTKWLSAAFLTKDMNTKQVAHQTKPFELDEPKTIAKIWSDKQPGTEQGFIVWLEPLATTETKAGEE